MHHPTDRITHITAFVTVVEHWLEQEIANGSTMKDRFNDPSHHERTLLPHSKQDVTDSSSFHIYKILIVLDLFLVITFNKYLLLLINIIYFSIRLIFVHAFVELHAISPISLKIYLT